MALYDSGTAPDNGLFQRIEIPPYPVRSDYTDATGMTSNQTLQETERLPAFADYLDHHPLPMWVYHIDTLRIVEVNEAATARYGYTREEFLAMTLSDLRPESDIPALQAAVQNRRKSQEPSFTQGTRTRHRTCDGEILDVEVHGYPYSPGHPELVAVVVHDLTRRHRLEQDLRRQTAYFRQLFENSPDGIVILDDQDHIIEANSAFLEMFGYPADECIGHSLNSLVAPEDETATAKALSDKARNNMLRTEGVLRKRKDGSTLRVDILGYPITTEDGRAGIYGIYRDASEKYEALQALKYRARHDSLTSLLNRHELESRIDELISGSRDEDSEPRHAFIYIDLDEFKLINDTSGHLAGDQLLIAVSNALKQNVKGSDAVARLGGDEFGLLLYNCNSDDARIIAERIRSDIAQLTLDWSEGRYSIGASIGVAMLDSSTSSFEELMNNADAACYVAKNSGKNRVEVYRADSLEIADRREQGSWILKLRSALGEDRFRLFRQKVMPMSDNRDEPEHYEILLRLEDEDGKLVPPAAFIPAAERFNLMVDIDLHVIAMVVRRMERQPEDETIYSINISGTSLGHPDFTRQVIAILEQSDIAMERLGFEITETAAIARMDMAKEFIAAVQALGARILLDDFGSGMSSFSYLKTLPVDILKIDGMFIRDMLANGKDRAIVNAFNQIGHALGMQTVAEFVENRETFEALRSMGIDFAQGYGIHKPAPWEDD